MTETPNKTRFRRLFRRLLRLPSFGVAHAVSLAVLVAFAVWMFVDATFPMTLQVVGIDMGLLDAQGIDTSLLSTWDLLGPRLVVFASLSAAGATAMLLVFYRILFGNRQGRSLRALFTAVAMVALWLGLAPSHKKLESAGFQWRLHRALPALKQDAAILLAKWPTTDGALPHLGPYTVHWDPPVLLLNTDDVISMNEQIGPFISQTHGGGVRFDYGMDFTRVEFHPDGGKPVSFDLLTSAGSLHFILQDYTELEPNWYYVTYSP